MKLDYIPDLKKDFKENLYTGIKTVNGETLFNGQVIGIGGEYDFRYAIVK